NNTISSSGSYGFNISGHGIHSLNINSNEIINNQEGFIYLEVVGLKEYALLSGISNNILVDNGRNNHIVLSGNLSVDYELPQGSYVVRYLHVLEGKKLILQPGT